MSRDAATIAVAMAAGLAWRLPDRLRTWTSDIGEGLLLVVAVLSGLLGDRFGHPMSPWVVGGAAIWAAIGTITGTRVSPSARARLSMVVVGLGAIGAAALLGLDLAMAAPLASITASVGTVLAVAIHAPPAPSELLRRLVLAGFGAAAIVAALALTGIGPESWLPSATVVIMLLDGTHRPRRRRSRTRSPIHTRTRTSEQELPEVPRETLMVIQRLTDPLAAQTQVVQALDDMFPGGRFELLRSPDAPRGLPATQREIERALMLELVQRGSVFRRERDELPKRAAAAFDALGGTLLLPVVFDATEYGALLVHYDSPTADMLVPARRFADLLASKLEIHRLYTELEQKQRLATLGTFSAALLHDLRNPLGTVRLNLQLLGRSAAGGVDREALTDAVRALDRVLAELSGTLDFTRPLALDVGTVDLVAIARRAVEDRRSDAELADLRLTFRASGDLPPVRGDEARLQRVLDNLVRNALEVAPAHTEVEVTLQRHRDVVELRVTDRGPGIDAGVGERIFEPFVSTKPGGVGLGLAIVKKVVERHGGTIAWERASPGTTMCVRIPQSN